MALKTIIVKGRGIRKEAKAGGAVTPGHLVKLNSSGEVVVHATAGGKAQRAFAVENELAGDEISVAYAQNDTCFYEVVGAGAEVYGLVAASAAAIVIGDLLESAGDGTLRKAGNILTDNSGGTANTTIQDLSGTYAEAEVANNFADVASAINALKANVLAIALEAVDNSGGVSAARILVEVL